ncbi:signal peptidase II [Sphaerisporangium rhizosphaerae]|uniref:Lipoprotein signal peptidase n=1 Tax=Sphaerisporangium rhizosphaerae TaxID=2269375 RepID=A0ABW2PHR0_9ACTN
MQAAGGTPLNASPDVPPSPEAPEPPEPSERAEGRDAPRGRRIGALAALAVLVYVLDLLSKTIVVDVLEGREPVRVIAGVLQLRVIRNSGAAFSIGTGMTIIFTVIAAVVVVAILRTARQLRSVPWAITLGLLLGGALGNLTDRLFRYPAPFQGHVVDWIEVFPVTRFPVFNIADSAIVCGGILAVFLAWRGYQIDGSRAGDERPAPSGGGGGADGTAGAAGGGGDAEGGARG